MKYLSQLLFSAILLLAACNAPDSSEQEASASTETEEASTPAPVEPSASADGSFTLGKSFLKIKAGMVPDDIEELYGDDFVKAQLPGGEGTTYDGFKLFPGTDEEVYVPPFLPARYLSIIIPPKAIGYVESETGLKIGTTLEELVAMNGASITFSGFDWDYGGYVREWNDGKLGNGDIVSLRLGYDYKENEMVPDSVIGEDDVSSENPDLKPMSVVVEEIVLKL